MTSQFKILQSHPISRSHKICIPPTPFSLWSDFLALSHCYLTLVTLARHTGVFCYSMAFASVIPSAWTTLPPDIYMDNSLPSQVLAQMSLSQWDLPNLPKLTLQTHLNSVPLICFTFSFFFHGTYPLLTCNLLINDIYCLFLLWCQPHEGKTVCLGHYTGNQTPWRSGAGLML